MLFLDYRGLTIGCTWVCYAIIFGVLSLPTAKCMVVRRRHRPNDIGIKASVLGICPNDVYLVLGGKDCLCEDIPLFVIGGGSNYWLPQVSYRDHL